MKLCDRCTVSGCCLNYLGKACEHARQETCPEVQPNNAEHVSDLLDNADISAMAHILAQVVFNATLDCRPGTTVVSKLESWLKEDYKPEE